MKVIESRWSEGRARRVYDQPRTPYRRLLEMNLLSRREERYLIAKYRGLEPYELARQIELTKARVRSLVVTKKATFGNPIYETGKELR
jgi:hypothetical protein